MAKKDFEFCPDCGRPTAPDVGCLNCPDEQDDLKYLPERMDVLEAE
jgi:hypothetical protein